MDVLVRCHPRLSERFVSHGPKNGNLQMDFSDGDWVDDFDPDYPLYDRDKYNKENQPITQDTWAEEDLEGDY